VTAVTKRPGLVTVEGVDGAGKSTHIELLKSILLETGREVLVTREPGPAIEAGQWVLCDRFTEASYAYQGAGRCVGFDRVAALEEWTQKRFRPSFTLLFLLDPDVAHRRVLGTGRKLDRFESERADFFKRVSQGYEQIAAQNPDRIRIIDAGVGPEEVAASLQSVMKSWLEE